MVTLLAFLFALAVLIVFHEFGHYLAARAFGVKVLRFSVGFGRPLLLRRWGRDQTEWVLAAIPFGGYVKMLGEQDDDVRPEEVPRAFNRQSVARRFVIVAAGPLANFLLAILLYWGLFIHGMPGQRPLLEAPAPGTAAAAAHFARWEVIERIDGIPVQTWEDVNWQLARRIPAGGSVRIGVRDVYDHHRERVLRLDGVGGTDLDKDFLARLGLAPAREIPARLGQVMPGSAAERAGLKPGDRITHVDGTEVTDWRAFAEAIRASAERPMDLTLVRDGRSRHITVVPLAVVQDGKRIGRIGVAPDVAVRVQYDPYRALLRAVQKTWDTSLFSLEMLGKMLMGQVSWSNLSGPLTIAHYAGETAQMGWLPFMLFLALVSVSLGVINLLPIPILDGGHLMYYTAEAIMRRPVSERALAFGQRIGIVVLILLMAVALYNDLVRHFGL